MRKFLAILICRIVRLIGKPLHRATSLPGRYALKVCPNILEKIKLPEMIIAVTGSNGKTSTTEMIASILRVNGKTVAHNTEGSNQIEGVTTMILSLCSFSGKMKEDILLIESDERYTRHTFKYFKPTHYVITNLYRDQLTRNGHPQFVYDVIKDSISDESILILNADDPQISQFGFNRENVVWFGLDNVEIDTTEHIGMYNDFEYCPICHKKLNYEYFHYNHIGKYSCSSCSFKRPDTSFSVTDINLNNSEITINNKDKISLAFKSIYNIYNILAAYTVCSLAGIKSSDIANTMSNYILKNGRYMEFKLGNHDGVFLVAKHENSIAYDMSMKYAVSTDKKFSVLLIVDRVSRKYFTSETSWLWDINFDLLDSDKIDTIYLCGLYANDLLTRFDFTNVSKDKLKVFTDVHEGCQYIKENGEEPIFTITCFSDKDKFLSNVEKV